MIQTAAKTNRLIIDTFSFDVVALEDNGLIRLADQAYAHRDIDTLERASHVLVNLPFSSQYEHIGTYYQALCLKRRGNFMEARRLLERVAEDAPFRYRARAINSLAAIEFDSGKFQDAYLLYNEGIRAGSHKNICDPYTVGEAQCMIAVLKSVDGDHHGALSSLKRTYPLLFTLSRSHSFIYYNYFNSVAVELLELGRVEEAYGASEIALASPYASAYPEYRETRNDIALMGRTRSRSFISLGKSIPPPNVLYMPERAYTPSHPIPGRKGELRSLESWKKKMVKKPKGNNGLEEIPEKMTDKEMLARLLRLTAKEDVDEKKLRKVLEYALKLFSELEEEE